MEKEEEPKNKKKVWIFVAIINIIILIIMVIYFLATKKLGFWKTLLIYSIVIGSSELLAYYLFKVFKKGKKKKEIQQPFFFEKKEANIEDAVNAAEKFAWDNYGVTKNKCEIYQDTPLAVKIEGTQILAYAWHFKEMISMKRKEYLIVCLVDNPKIIGGYQLKKQLERNEITEYAKEMASQRLEIKHSKTTKINPVTGEETIDEIHEPVIPPQIEVVKPAGKL